MKLVLGFKYSYDKSGFTIILKFEWKVIENFNPIFSEEQAKRPRATIAA